VPEPHFRERVPPRIGWSSAREHSADMAPAHGLPKAKGGAERRTAAAFSAGYFFAGSNEREAELMQ